jgi:hypothetical protein
VVPAAQPAHPLLPAIGTSDGGRDDEAAVRRSTPAAQLG